MTSNLDYEDLWHAGFACGLSSLGWLEVVAGRFLANWQRRELADGWLAGFHALESSRRADAEAADERGREREMARELVAVADDGDELPW